MSICEDASASAVAGTGIRAFRSRAATPFKHAVALLSGWRNRRTVLNMRDFDDAQLADIGLSRHDVESALRTRGVDPTQHLISARQNPLRGIRYR